MRTPLAILTTLALAAPLAPAQDGAPTRKPRLDLRATPRVAFSPVRVHVTAVLVGGEPSPEYHCPTLEWDWDDGNRSVRESDCEPLEDGADFERRFSAEHAFAKAGMYDVQVKVLDGKRLLAVGNARINVRPGPGDFSDVADGE
jgi:hypothetical protein